MNSSKSGESDLDRGDYLSNLIGKLKHRKSRLQMISRNYSNIRLILLLSEVTIFFILFFLVSNVATIISVAIFLVVFITVSNYHSKIDWSIKKTELWLNIKTAHLARLERDWNNIPSLINIIPKPEVNETDLDIVGEASLLQLINTGTTKQSVTLLREWFNVKIHGVDEIIERQELVKELIPLTIFRDKLTLHSILFSNRDFHESLLDRLLSPNEEPIKTVQRIFILLLILAPINALLLVLFVLNLLPAYWVIPAVIYVLLYRSNKRNRSKIFSESEYLLDELKKVAGVFGFLEGFRFKKDSKLYAMCESFITNKQSPSYLINKIKGSVELLRIRKANPFIWFIFRVVFPVDFYLNLRIEKYKRLIGKKYNIWMDTWYNLEAICSLANFAHLNPGYTFPGIVDNDDDKITFLGMQLGHPLIKNNICNDFSFSPAGEIAIVTGSNMSGKSTFMRTLGTNLTLAYAGSVVNADRMEVSLLNMFTCIRINDSIKDGISFFYAEVKRLKALLDEIKQSDYPVLFLIDEIFRGTNNIERLIGSSALIKRLSQTNASGVVATHDLELVKLSDAISKVRNYHFKEEIKEGKMSFNYLLNAGPCPTTNALKIMKMEGLPIEE